MAKVAPDNGQNGSGTVRAEYDRLVELLDSLAAAFINTFGITQPSGAARRRASWFIFGMLLLTLLLVSTGGFLLYVHLRRGAAH